jgi:hypothetical protein
MSDASKTPDKFMDMTDEDLLLQVDQYEQSQSLSIGKYWYWNIFLQLISFVTFACTDTCT